MSDVIHDLRRVFPGFIASVLLLSGCQPTPEQSAVVGKRGTLAAQIAQPPAQEEAYKAPERWSDQIADGQLTIKIDAALAIPDAVKYPVLKIQPEPIDIAYAHRIADHYMQGQSLYQLIERTKGDIDKQILDRKKLLSKAQTDPSSAYGFALDDSSIAILEEEKSKAPDKVEKKSSDFSFETRPEGRSLFVQTEKGDSLSLFNGKDGLYNTLRYTKAPLDKGELIDTMARTDDREMPFSLSQAMEYADAFLESMEVKDYRFFEKELAVRVTGAQYDVFAGITTDPVFLNQAEKGYVLFYTPCYNGIPKNFSFTDNIVDAQENVYNEIWGDELIRLYVSSDGVEKMEWSDGIGQTTEVLNENIGLAPFETIQKRFSEQILRSFYTDSLNQDCKTTLEISKITLSYRKILVQGSESEYMLVPAWDFYGRKVMEFAPGADVTGLNLQVIENNTAIEEYFSHSHLTLSAIDGSVIDNIQGY